MSEVRVIENSIFLDDVKAMAKEDYLDMVKAVVDVKRGLMAVGGGMHADAEEALLQKGSAQEDLWGINIFPDKPKQEWIEFQSLINIRPRQNRGMIIQDDAVRNKIKEIVAKLIQ